MMSVGYVLDNVLDHVADHVSDHVSDHMIIGLVATALQSLGSNEISKVDILETILINVTNIKIEPKVAFILILTIFCISTLKLLNS